MDILTSPFAYGVYASIFGAFAVLFIQYLFIHCIRPIYISLLQQSPNFNNTIWHGYSDEGCEGPPESTLFIKQYGNTITATSERNSRSGVRKFVYKGTIFSGQIVLSFHEERAEQYIVGTMVLHVGSNLRILKGASLYYHHDSGRVISTPKFFRRQQT